MKCRLAGLMILLFCSKFQAKESTIYIMPFCQEDVDRQHDITPPLKECLQKLGYSLKYALDLTDIADVAYLVTFGSCLGQYFDGIIKQPKEKLIQFIFEHPSVDPVAYSKGLKAYFGKVFTWRDDLVGTSDYIKFYMPYYSLFRIVPSVDFEEKKFCTTVLANKGSRYPSELYTERRKTIEFFESMPEGTFDLYGRDWAGAGYKNYKGPIYDKIECISHYKFCIAYENIREIQGYVSEKMLDCLVAGCVPVYWGASNIADYVPKECFIDRRDFKDNQELYDFLKKVTQEEYQSYIDNGKKFLASDKALLFSNIHFVHIFLKNLIPEYEPHLVFNEQQLEILRRLGCIK